MSLWRAGWPAIDGSARSRLYVLAARGGMHGRLLAGGDVVAVAESPRRPQFQAAGWARISDLTTLTTRCARSPDHTSKTSM